MQIHPDRIRTVRRACVALTVSLLAGGALAQARLTETESPASSPLTPALERLDEALRQQTVSAGDAAGRWISGQMSSLDPVVQVREFAAAASRDSKELLYAASLGRACIDRTQPPIPECDERDVLAYFATRDSDNAVPWLLLADRARRRAASVPPIDNLERAATAARYDDYTERSAALFMARLRPLATTPLLAAVAADRYAARASGIAVPAVEALCGRKTVDERASRACLRLAALMIERAPNAADRAAGAAIAQIHATTESAKAAADAQAREIAVRRQSCNDVRTKLERMAAGPSAAGVEGATDRWIASRATTDELSACDALAKAM